MNDDTLITALDHHARRSPDKDAMIFVENARDEGHRTTVTYSDLARRSGEVAAVLAARAPRQSHVLVMLPPGPGFVTAFVGCLRAGLVAVPAPLPGSGGARGSRAAGIAADADVAAVITDDEHVGDVEVICGPAAGPLPVLTVERIPLQAPGLRPPDAPAPDDVAFLQYTSGSTSDPKGVIVDHGALLDNLVLIEGWLGSDEDTRVCSWLPMFHDMGLIGMLLQTIHLGATVVVLTPTDFLRRPRTWLDLVDEYSCHLMCAPNFAYDFLAARVAVDESLDLSSVRWVLNGSEPVDPATLRRFGDTFAAAGLDERALMPCYGLAESTLLVAGTPAGQGARTTTVDVAELEADRLVAGSGAGPVRDLVSSGRPVGDLDVRIVDADTHVELDPGLVGEVWVRGRSVARGYWRRPEVTQQRFGAVTVAGDGGFLRTGDLGTILDGELYITGRCQDVLVVRGRNLYPHDLERQVAELHPGFTGLPGCVCQTAEPGSELVVMQEIRLTRAVEVDLPALARRVRGEIGERFGVGAGNVVLLRPGQVRRTTSGKVRRDHMRELFEGDELETLHQQLTTTETRRREPAGVGGEA